MLVQRVQQVASPQQIGGQNRGAVLLLIERSVGRQVIDDFGAARLDGAPHGGEVSQIRLMFDELPFQAR